VSRDHDQWPLFGEYSTDAITAALALVPGAGDLRPGRLDGGGPLVRFTYAGGRAGGVGCFSPAGGYLVVLGYLDETAPPGSYGRSYGLKSRKAATSDAIPAAITELAREVMPRDEP
jgi:hypothetical protein